MKGEMLRLAYGKYKDTCELYNGSGASSGLLLKVNLCDIQFMQAYMNELCACFDFLKEEEIRNVLDLEAYMVTYGGRVPLRPGQVISVKEYARYKKYKFGLEAQTGARAFYTILKNSTLSAIIESHKMQLNSLAENCSADPKIDHLESCIRTLEEFKDVAPADSPLCMFRRNFIIKTESYDEVQDSLCIADTPINRKNIEVINKNQMLYSMLEANAGAIMITQARKALKDASGVRSFTMPLTDDVTDVALIAALNNVGKRR